jgi:hypothetical protein
VRFFRRRETLNEKLLREGRLDAPEAAERPAADRSPPDVYDPVVEGRMMTSGFGPLPSRQGDAIAWAQAPEIGGDEVRFYVLEDGSVVVDEEEGDAALEPFCDAIENELRPPYAAHARRREDGWWLVTGSRIDVVEIDAPGDEIEIARTDGQVTTTVDGEPGDRVAELERYAERFGESFAVEATRLDGNRWAVRGDAL